MAPPFYSYGNCPQTTALPRKLTLILVLLVILPLGLLGWLGTRVMHDETEMVEVRFAALIQQQLADVDARIASLIREREARLLQATEIGRMDVRALRERARRDPMVAGLFVIGADGGRLFPPENQPLSTAESEFLRRTRRLRGDLGEAGVAEQAIAEPQSPVPAAISSPSPLAQSRAFDDTAAEATVRDRGWSVWYWEDGISLIFWRRDDRGRVIGAELSRIKLLSDIVGLLPDRSAEAGQGQRRIVLLDAQDQPVYHWGGYMPTEDEAALGGRRLAFPLSAWRLEYHAPGIGLAQGWTLAPVYLSLTAVFLVVLWLALYLFREHSRELREAARRVNFVNQVSHELKTPLTNIRMYAELLDEELEEDDPSRSRLKVIVTEAQRLSRLIANVLSFARQRRRALRLRPAAVRVDAVVRRVLDQFAPSLEAKGIRVEVDAEIGDELSLDGDVLGQILGNLIGNVEKYAAAGGYLGIETRQTADEVTISVRDRGPGIPLRQRERVFEAFYRGSDRLTEGVAGTGIGLTIARDLARLHGGDLRLVDTDGGAEFVLTLRPLSEDAA